MFSPFGIAIYARALRRWFRHQQRAMHQTNSDIMAWCADSSADPEKALAKYLRIQRRLGSPIMLRGKVELNLAARDSTPRPIGSLLFGFGRRRNAS